jgi:hypothetical protein
MDNSFEEFPVKGEKKMISHEVIGRTDYFLKIEYCFLWRNIYSSY